MDEYGWRTVFHWDTFIVVLFLYLQVQLPEIWTCGSSLAECSGPNSDSKVTLSQENLRRWLLFSCRHWSLVITRSQSILLSEDSWLGSCSIAQLGSCTNKQSICGRLHRSRQKKKKRSTIEQLWREAIWLQVNLSWHTVTFSPECDSECDLSVQEAAAGLATGHSCSLIAFTLWSLIQATLWQRWSG